VKRLLKLKGLPGPDAADALGLAITHAHARQSANLLMQAQLTKPARVAPNRGVPPVRRQN
jgi:hypothetical protein